MSIEIPWNPGLARVKVTRLNLQVNCEFRREKFPTPLPVETHTIPCPLLPVKMNLFGKAKAKDTPKDAIVRIRDSLEMLEKREKFLNLKIENELKIAKANATKNKRGN
jgi:charged multivesicular body protein 4